VDKTTAQQPTVQQFESTRFQDPQAAADTSGNYYYYSSDGKGFGGKIFSATRVVSSKNSQFTRKLLLA